MITNALFGHYFVCNSDLMYVSLAMRTVSLPRKKGDGLKNECYN